MKLNLAFAAALLMGAAAPAAAAQVTVGSFDPMPNYKVGTIHNAPPGIGPSGFPALAVEVTPFTFHITAPSTYDIVTYCIDIAHYLNLPATYQVTDVTSVANVAAHQTEILRILTNTLVVGANPLLKQTDTAKGAGIQLAIWEILNETGATFDIAGGSFFADNSLGGNLGAVGTSGTALDYAAQYLTISQSGAVNGNYALQLLTSPTPSSQAQLFLIAVPEPATWAMMISGFGLIGGVLRMQRRQTRNALA